MAKIKPVKNHKLIFDDGLNSLKFDVAIVLGFLVVCYWVMKPIIEMPPQRDSGCFLYIGQNWLKGMIPYKDMWDHKGPVLYLLNAIGILINGVKGVMFLQVILTSVGFYYTYKVCCKYANFIASILLTVSGFFFLFFLHQSGNQTEQWAIFFQGLSLYLYFKIKDDHNNKGFIAIGVLMACSFLLRPNQVALWLIMGIAELLPILFKKQTFKMLLSKIGYGLCGFSIPVVFFSAYFMFHHAFDEMMDCLFVFNFIYTGKSETPLLANILIGIKSIPFLWFILAGIVFNLIVFISKFREVRTSDWFLFLFGIVWLKLEIIMSLMAGSGHLHYYVQWILPLILAICSILNAVRLIFKDRQTLIYSQITMTLFLTGALYYKVKSLHAVQMDGVMAYRDENRFREKVVERIMNETDDSDYVLEWGMVDGINFMSGRKSPTRYFYQYALDTKGYTNKGIVAEFLDEVKQKKPKLIIDASCMERFPQIDSINRDSLYRAKPHLKGLIPDNINEFYAYVESNYRYEGSLGFMLIFKRKE